MGTTELLIVVPIVTAVISFAAAVVAVVIGQNLGQKGQCRNRPSSATAGQKVAAPTRHGRGTTR